MAKKDDGFTQRMVVLLCTAMADRNHADAKMIIRALAKEHDGADYADKVMGRGAMCEERRTSHVNDLPGDLSTVSLCFA
jgi:hypothetical protein